MTETSTRAQAQPDQAIPHDLAKALPAIGMRWKGSTLVVASPIESWPTVLESAHDLGFEIDLIEAGQEEVLQQVEIAFSQQFLSNEALLTKASEAGEAPIAKLVDLLLERAVLERASDLHLEPFDNEVVVRLRIDGRLRELIKLPGNVANSVASRIKILSQLNIVERRRPQDGQFTVSVEGHKVDARVSTVATMHGEKVVLRLHDSRKPLVTMEELGMSHEQLTSFQTMIGKPNGLVLAAGPTGSGKTTTLHSALRALHAPDKNLTTIEDPIEYVVHGINQIPISEATGTGFAVQLRAILRQDPDIILVGETRDAETARISVQASLTGHLVLSSIHANDAVGSIYRLLQMGVEPHLIASALTGIIAQRLIRRVCQFCSASRTATSHESRIFEDAGITEYSLVEGLGCTFCGGSGYRDRIAAYQLLNVSEPLANLISQRPEPMQLRQLAMKEGMKTIGQEALRLAAEGKTTFEEALTLHLSGLGGEDELD